MSGSIKLYWNKICPFVHRSWIAAVEKNVPVELVYVPLGGDMPAWYTAINPRETVPTLQHGEKLIFESNLIVDYLDGVFEPKNSLSGGSALERAKIRRFQSACGAFIGSAYTYLRGGATKQEAAQNLAVAARQLNDLVEGPFVLGNTFTVADIHIVPFLDRFRYTLKVYNNFNVFDGVPKLERLLREAMLRPSVYTTAQPGDFYVNSYKAYAPGEPLAPRQWTVYVKPGTANHLRFQIIQKIKDVPLVFVDKNDWADDKVEVRDPNGTIFEGWYDVSAPYIDESFAQDGKRLLLPVDPVARYDTLMFVTDWFELADGDWKAREALAGRTVKSGKFVGGEHPNIADVAILPELVQAGASLAEYPTLQGIVQAAHQTKFL